MPQKFYKQLMHKNQLKKNKKNGLAILTDLKSEKGMMK